MAKAKRSKFSLYFIYPLVFFVFIIFSVFYLLSARGYTFQFSLAGLSFEKTGMLVLGSKPSEAEIILNGRVLKKKTVPFFSTKIDHLMSGSYDVTVRKAGFLEWKKTLGIFPEEVTWANYILLFQKNPEVRKLSIAGLRTDVMGSEDGKFSVISTNDLSGEKIHLLNHASGEVSLVKNLSDIEETLRPKNIKFIAWTKDRQLVLIEGSLNGKVSSFYLDLGSRRIEPLVKDPSLTFDKISTDTSGGNNAFVLIQGQLSKFDIVANTLSDPLETKVVYFSSQNGKVYYVKDENQSYVLMQMNSDGSSKSVIFDSIPKADSYKIDVSSKNHRIALVVGSNEVLYILDKNKNRFTMERVDEKVPLAKWNQDGARLLYSDASRIYVSDFETKKDYVIGLSSTYSHLKWYDQNHILGTKKGVPVVMEYEGKNVVELSVQKNINAVFFSNDNRDIYFMPSKSEDEASTNLFLYKVKF